MKFKRIQQVRLHEQIVDTFHEMAESGEIKPGDRLPPERELLVQFGVSRQVLREAFTVLESQGLVSTTPGGGRKFLGQTKNDTEELIDRLKGSAFLEILDARAAIECKAAELAAVSATDAEIEELEGRISKIEMSDYTFEWNYQFHLAIAEASRNGILHSMLQLLLEARRDVSDRDYLSREQLERLFQDHRKIVDAIKSREPTLASGVMRRHIEITIEMFERHMDKRDLQ